MDYENLMQTFNDNFMTVQEAAVASSLDTSSIRKALVQGRIQRAFKIKGTDTWMIYRPELENILKIKPRQRIKTGA